MAFSAAEFVADFPSHAREGVRLLLVGQAEAAIRALSGAGAIGAVSASGFTPVFLASLIGDREAVEGLLRAGAHPDGDPRFAPVHAAALRGTAILRRLLAAVANPDGRAEKGRAPPCCMRLC